MAEPQINSNNNNINDIEHQSNLAKGGIAFRLHSAAGSSNKQLRVLVGVRPQIFPPHRGSGTPSNTMCHWTAQVYLPNSSNGLSRGANVTDDRQTDHATEKCVAIGVVACARAIPPNNNALISIL